MILEAGAALLLAAAPGAVSSPDRGPPGHAPPGAARSVVRSAGASVRLAVPAVRQSPERCGPAALGMVLRFYGAGPEALAEADRAYDRALRGALITDLAAAARRAGYAAEVVTLPPDSLAAWLARGVPPIVLYQSGVGPLTRPHYAVVVGWDAERHRWALNDGGAAARAVDAAEFSRRHRGSDDRALIVRPGPAVTPAGAGVVSAAHDPPP